MASLLQTRSRGWPLKGLGLASPDYQVGAHFEALNKGVLMAGLKFFEHFFAISKLAAALCTILSFLTTFFTLMQVYPIYDPRWYHYVLQLRKFPIQKLGTQALNCFKIWDGNPEGP